MYNQTYKVIIVGDEGVGKSLLVSKFLNDAIFSEYMPTIGVDFHTKIVEVDPGDFVRFAIWDISGRPTFRPLISNFYKCVVGCIAVYDVTQVQSFQNIVDWINNVKKHNESQELNVILVGTKTDILDSRKVSTQDGTMTAFRNGWLFAEIDYTTSSATIFKNLARAISHKLPAPVQKEIINEKEQCCCQFI